MNEMSEKNMKETQDEISGFVEVFNTLKNEISRFIVGQEDIIEKVIISVICGGHVLLEGVPGLGKTALVHSVASALELDFKRIQFTPDLLPADVIGTNLLLEEDGGKQFTFQKGPVFTNVLLADEINRATPKTQSALLETMQEKTVTVAGNTYKMDLPFFVLATQNPLEMDGTYPLPEAQLDRFFFKLKVDLPEHDEFITILQRTSGSKKIEINPVTDGDTILRMGEIAADVPIDESVMNYLVEIVRATHPGDKNTTDAVKKYIRFGASPRAAQTILASAQVKALLNGRYHVSCSDVNEVAVPAIRHRIILSFEGEAEGVTTDEVINGIISELGNR